MSDGPPYSEAQVFGKMRPLAHRPRSVRCDFYGKWAGLGFEQAVSLDESIDMHMGSTDRKAEVRMDIRRTADVDLVVLINQLHKHYAKHGTRLTRSWVAMDGTNATFQGTVRRQGRRDVLHVIIRTLPKQPEYTLVVIGAWPRATDAQRLASLDGVLSSLQFE